MPETVPGVDENAELLAARDGDDRAARELVARHGESMMRTAWRVLGRYGRRDADDVVQEAFVAALTTTALPAGNVGAWLRAITARKALDELRRLGRRAEDPIPETEDGGRQLVSAERVEHRLDVLEVRKALSGLSPTDRALLTLVDLEGWSLREAAGFLGLTYVAVKLRASRARRKLARRLGEADATGGA
jgi:RNA polymerase sigma-70 factor (ECF subfamily)